MPLRHPAGNPSGRVSLADAAYLPRILPLKCPPATSAHPTLVPTTEPAFQPLSATTNRTLERLGLLTEDEFRGQFWGSPVKRAKWRELMRNVAAALGELD
jgi:epoxyqueuosine reductase QueG